MSVGIKAEKGLLSSLVSETTNPRGEADGPVLLSLWFSGFSDAVIS